MDLSGASALVTGGASGLGFATAKRLADAGAHVVIVDLPSSPGADRAAEALILERLAALYPGVQTVAEEAVSADGAPEAAEDWFWLIDPLDGTRGFVRGGEAFTVNIALIHDGYPVAGVVTAPATATTWRTDKPEGGAFRRQFGALQAGEAHSGEDWRPIRVRDRPQEGMALLSHSVTDEEATRLAARHGCSRWQGTDSSLKFCLVATGEADLYPRLGRTMEWDTAAGDAVLRGAGGQVVRFDDHARLSYGKPGQFVKAETEAKDDKGETVMVPWTELAADIAGVTGQSAADVEKIVADALAERPQLVRRLQHQPVLEQAVDGLPAAQPQGHQRRPAQVLRDRRAADRQRAFAAEQGYSGASLVHVGQTGERGTWLRAQGRGPAGLL